MQVKTRNRLDKREENRQLSFLDACIFLEILLSQPKKEECTKWIRSFRGKSKRAVISSYCLGEIVSNIYGAKEKYEKIDAGVAFLALDGLLNDNGITIVGIEASDIFKAIEIRSELDNRISARDALNLASAFNLDCVNFCTIETRISVETVRKLNMKLVSSFVQ